MTSKRSYSFNYDEKSTSPLNTKRKCDQDLRDKKKCYSCDSEIKSSQFSYKVNNCIDLHPECLKCKDCDRFLTDNDTCFIRQKQIYCKQDYVRNFSMSCSRCHRNFNGNDYVIRARYHLYHIGCFRCDICRKNIVGGQEFASFQGKIYCSKDFETIIHRNARERKKVINASPNKTDVNLKTDDEQCESDDSSDDKEQDETCTRSGQRKEKATRVRTVLNEKQLYTLRTCYGANPRPDALLKEQLVEMTNLSPRVIRVWFQNKRCKDKKKAILMKQMQEHQKLRAIGHSAMPLIASDPISNEICVNEFVPQMDITTIHNPWISNDYINVPMQSTSTTGNEQHTIQQTFTLNQNQQLNNMQLNQQQNGLQQQSIRHRQPLQQPHHSQYQNSEQRGPHENNNDEDDFFDLMSSTDCRKNGDYFDLFDDLPDT